MTPEGPRLGRDLKVAEGPVIFKAFRTFHFTRSWTGDRLILLAYITEAHEHLAKDDRAWLEGLGFNLPRAGETEVEWEAYQEPFTDGFGLCSPTRWRPEDRGGLLSRSRSCRSDACTCTQILARSGGGCKSPVQ